MLATYTVHKFLIFFFFFLENLLVVFTKKRIEIEKREDCGFGGGLNHKSSV